MNYEDSFMSKRDRRRLQIQTKLKKLDMQFNADKDYQYREALVELQYRLSSLHQGDNPVYSQKVQDLRDARDYELLRLRLAEEYSVKLINDQFTQQYNETVADANTIVAMVKQKLHDGLVQKIRQLKEDKALIDIVTSSSSSHTSRARSNLQEGSSLGLTKDARDSKERDMGNTSGIESSTSFFFSGERRSRRKREGNDFSLANGSNDDSYDSTSASGTRKRNKAGGAEFSANEEGKVITENTQLNEFLYGPQMPKRKEKNSGLGMRKGHTICPPLKVEEVNEDLTILRSFKRSRRV